MAERVVVVGAGMVGLMAAYSLRRRGFDVTLLDAGEAGRGCSFGNAGFICPSLCAPLPAPGLASQSLRWMFERQSPLYIRPSALPKLLPWLLAFWRHCNHRDYAAGFEAMLDLNRTTLTLYDRLASDGVAFEMHEQGLLFVFLDARRLASELRELEDAARALGLPAPVALDRDRALAAEPALSDRVVGALLAPAERHVEPRSLSLGLRSRLLDMGVDLLERTPVTGFERHGDAVSAARCCGTAIAGDAFVLAAGVFTGPLAAWLGVRLPLTAGKGYSVTVSGANLSFAHAIYLAGTKAVLSPFEGAVRIAGTMELSGVNDVLDPLRVAGLRAAVGRHLRTELCGAKEEAWTGMRPLTPDGLPVIGRLAPLANVFACTGHGANGIFMAPASAELLADWLTGEVSAQAAAPFDPGRFRRPLPA